MVKSSPIDDLESNTKGSVEVEVEVEVEEVEVKVEDHQGRAKKDSEESSENADANSGSSEPKPSDCKWKYPPTSYSLIALGNPSAKAFGIFTFVVQISLLCLLFYGYGSQKVFGNLKSMNHTTVTILTQIFALIGFFSFSEYCLPDVYDALMLCPNPMKPDHINGRKWVFVACILQLTLGLLSVPVAVFLIISRFEPFFVILSITTVDTIAKFDDKAYKLAKTGRYTMAIAEATKVVDSTPIPKYAILSHLKEEEEPNQKEKNVWHRRHLFKIYAFFVFAGSIGGFVAFKALEGTHPAFTTRSVRMHLKNSTGLQDYSGCYVRGNKGTIYHRRSTTTTNGATTKIDASLGYCDKDSRWLLYSGDTRNPCEGTILLRSKVFEKYKKHDISATFEKGWFFPIEDYEEFDTFVPYLAGDDDECNSLSSEL